MTASEEAGPHVPIADPLVGSAEREAVARVLDSGQLADGPEVRAFESEFAGHCETDHAVAAANGTAALHAALAALELGPGDAVLTTPFTFVATANAVRFVGAEPVFADVDPETFTLDPASVEETIRARDGDVDAIVAVHLYGLPAEMDRLAEVADRYDAALVEDAAQAHGATYRGQPVGGLADVGCFSFYPTKNMTTGEGGMVVTDRDDVARRARSFVNHGRDDSGRHETVGHNFRLSGLAAAIGRVQLDRLPSLVEARRDNASYLTARLADAPVRTPAEPAHLGHAYNQYTVATDQRDDLAAHLADAGIDSAVYYPRLVTDEPAYEAHQCSAPAAAAATDSVLSLPVHPGLSETALDRVVEAVQDWEPP
jgi:dTDP-4-amino-4,6-dideoxygalactose transaminase